MAHARTPGRKKTNKSYRGDNLEDYRSSRSRSRSPVDSKRPRENFEAMQDGAPKAGLLSAPTGSDAGHGGAQNPSLPVENELKFGQKQTITTKKFKKSFLCTVDNGVQYLNVANNGGTGTLQSFVIWNEGWQIIPWADVRAYLTPIDVYNLHMQNRKFRVKSTKVTLEGIVPFQVDLTGGTNTTTATFNNRVNLHIYTDDGELLPDYNLSMDNIAHSEVFTMPWGVGLTGALKPIDFAFNEATIPSGYRYCYDTEFNAAKPQKFFSLYDTGCVESYYPGQKYEKAWTNPLTQWVGRPPNGVLRNSLQIDAPTQEDLLTEVARACGMEWQSGITGRSAAIPSIPIDNSVATNQKCNYIDTGVPMKMEGLPYILVRVEPYPNLGAGAGLVNIYAQFHLHYEMEVEVMPLEKPRTYVPIRSGTVQTQGTSANMSTQFQRDLGYGITDNIIGRAFAPARDDVVYT